ncbi:MAG: hypothetical protein IJ532_00030 [Alphaproteobacteria bacterium]|nr:hypothetical protein [Alphaproteobacteria bacterium]
MKKLTLFLIAFWCSNAHCASIDKNLLNEMLTTINRQYIKPIDNVKTVTAGLSGLSDLDDGFVVSHGIDRIYIYYNHKINGVVPIPKDTDDITAWVNSIAKAIENAAQISEKVALRDFEVPDLIMKRMVRNLDEHSHYYSEYEYNEDEENNAIFTLYADRMIDDILYLRIRIFNKQTGRMVEQSLKDHPDAKGVILDLRGNGGGMFNEALKVAKLFCDNEIITYTAGRNEENKHYYTSGEGALYSGPLVVLIDGETASAAEVLAGGLQEQSRAEIIGAHSFGKGTIQKITLMSNGGRLVLTGEQFFTPSGKVIHKKGIEPDICLNHIVDGRCEQTSRVNNEEDIDKAIEILNNEI